jgi:SAM-dependent methyltransferase
MSEDGSSVSRHNSEPVFADLLREVLRDHGVQSLEGGLVASSVPISAGARFYDEFFDAELSPATARRTLWKRAKASNAREATHKADPFLAVLDRIEELVGPDARVLEIGGGIYQSRSAFAYRRFPRYVPLDLSLSSISRYAREFGRPGIVADATDIPIRDHAVDAVFTRTFLEHVPNPELALREIFRIVRPGGVIIHEDAWFCRWWQRHAVVGLIPWPDMQPRERLVFICSRLTELKPIRASVILFNRLLRESLPDGQRLCFGRLRPNYELRLGCDEDAASSLDPSEVARFYARLGGSSPSHGTPLARVWAKSRRLEIRKPLK